MRIALVILHADPARGGAERYTIDLADALARRGHDVSLLASSFLSPASPSPGTPGEGRGEGQASQVHCVTIPSRGLTRAARYRVFLDHLDQHLGRTEYDIVHAMFPVRWCDLYHPHAGVAADAIRRPNNLFNPRRRSMARIERELLGREDGPLVLCLSEYIKGFVTRHYSLPPRRLQTLFNAVDLDRFAPAAVPNAPHQEVRALIIANDFERKGVLQAIGAVDRVDDPRLSLDIIGRGRIRPLEIGPSIRIRGEVADPRELYRNADFFVLPTKHDPCSLVVLEALAIGLPVISTRFNGACEIMTDGVHGFVLDDPEDANALAEAMRKMLDPNRRSAMREACLALRPRLSYEHHLDRLEEIYRNVRPRRRISQQDNAAAR